MKKIYNTGYIGVGRYKSTSKNYASWFHILERCYCKKYQKTQPTYVDVEICEEWKNFQNYAIWFDENHIEGWHLDKDLLVSNNKIYSPETCCFLPQEINNLLTNRQNFRGKYPLGVTKQKNIDSYRVTFTKNKKQVYLGSFKCLKTASKTYIDAKESYIKEVANIWKDKLPINTYNALLNYKIIEIN